MAGITAQRMAQLQGPLGWGDSCRLLTVEEALPMLRGFELFAGLSDEDLTMVAELSHECTWSAGSVLFHEGDNARNFCILLEGQVALEKEIRLGPHSPARQATVEFLVPGGALAWSSLVPPFRYTRGAVAIQPTRALCMDGQSFRDLMQRHPPVGLSVMAKVAVLIKSRLGHQTEMLLYFLSIVSHELRAPLAAVENYLNVMLSGYAGPLTQDQQVMLERSVVRLGETSDLIAGVLDLARMHPEQIRQAFEPVDLREVVVEAVEDVQLRMKQKGQQLDLDMPEELPIITAAHGRLRQVLSNLLSNAVKFSPKEATVRLVVRAQEGMVRIEVIDCGVGIPKDELNNIFEAFYRTRGGGEAAGLGLGLSIAQRIVDAHGGRIRVESPYPPGGKGGSCFVIELPVDPLESM
jgi:signal transduction histidine kinase